MGTPTTDLQALFGMSIHKVSKIFEGYQLRITMKTLIVAGIDPVNIAEAVETVVSMKWDARYDLCEDFSPSSVVINVLRSQITNYF